MWKTLRQADAPLTATALLMLPVLALAIAGLALDPRIATGASVWLKPAKFAASIAVYSATLAWIFTLIPDWVRTRRIVGRTTAAAMIVEMTIIAFQAARGTTSHFNVGTTFDGLLWTIMGAAIVVQTVTTIAVAVALCRQRFADRAVGWALRLGMIITIAGAFSGGLMTGPTPAQLAAARAGQRMSVVGAHTVGGPDGGAGLPGTGWSREHGDLRVAHFVGLHALQALPLLALGLRRSRFSEAVRVRLTVTGAGSYVALFAIMVWQALRGQPVFTADVLALASLGAWAALTALAMIISAGPWWHAGPRHGLLSSRRQVSA